MNFNLIEKLRKLISDGHIEEVFDELLNIIGTKKNILLLLQSNYSTLINDFKMGVATPELASHKNRITLALLELIDGLEAESRFSILNSREDRTKEIIGDLEELTKKEKYLERLARKGKYIDMKIWSVAFLSIFALGDKKSYFDFKKGSFNYEEKEKEDKVFELLEKEKELLLNLAFMGYEIRCIICPVNSKNVSEDLNDALYRTTQLIEFLKNNSKDSFIETSLGNIHWAITEFPQRNVYILGDISIYEGYKKGHEQFGFGLTSRQTFKEVIFSNLRLYEKYFEELSCRNLSDSDWKSKKAIKKSGCAALRREYAIFKLEESKDFLEQLLGFKSSPGE